MGKDLVVAVIGYIAAVLTTAAYVPQVVHVFRRRSADDISTTMYIAMTCGVGCWLVYGVMLRQMPIVVANGIILVLASTVLYAKARFRKAAS
jgi:MtN3 and saliva related transmembrane protein